MRIIRSILLTVALLLVAVVPAAAEMPSIRNGELTTHSASSGLDATFRNIVEHQSDPAWAGYEVPCLPGYRMFCGHCERHDCLCRLESNNESYSQTSSSDSDETQEPGVMFVLFRVNNHRIERIRTYSSYCRLDAGGLPFHWLADVRPSESVTLLESITDPSGSLAKHTKGMTEGAITAIAFHADQAAAMALERLVGPEKPVDVRKHAIFWVGENGGPHGVETLRRVLHDDPDHEVREGAVFALSCSSAPAALDLLMQTAREDKDPKIRSNALFWLASKAGEKSAKAIADAVENDPDADVKEQAVFALSQLPKERGVPLLIQVARTNRSPKVREQAIFWLGQSEDERALDFFEEVLSQ
jgi:HEAT repeat protein